MTAPLKHTIALRRLPSHDVDPSKARALRPDHPALEAARTIFPHSVKHPDSGEPLLVSGHNNRKLGARVMRGSHAGMPIFQLSLEERDTCPRSCHLWAACYGNSMHLARRISTKDPDRFFIALDHALGKLQRAHPTGFMLRLHTLGDFFSRQYVDAWRGWLVDFPALHAFGYTRFLPDAPDDVEAEIGSEIEAIAMRNWDRFAIRQSRTDRQAFSTIVLDEPDPSIVMCPAQTHESECCATCGLCWAKAMQPKPIGFLRHGMKARGPVRETPPAEAPLEPADRTRPLTPERLAQAIGVDGPRAEFLLQRISVTKGRPVLGDRPQARRTEMR